MSLSSGFDTSCVATSSGDVYCWGQGDHWQNGTGVIGNPSSAAYVTGLCALQ